VAQRGSWIGQDWRLGSPARQRAAETVAAARWLCQHGVMATLDPERVSFLQGLLVGLASAGQIIDFEELRKLCGCSQPEFIPLLEAARAPMRAAGQPDCSAIVISSSGLPAGFRDLELWDEELMRAHHYCMDLRNLTEDEFEAAHGARPAVPAR
jgi:hypothetical protein